MKTNYVVNFLITPVVLFGILIFAPDQTRAHCDTMDGPVVKAAQRALATRDVNPVLIWVQKKDEAEIKQRFQQTLAVRKLNREAKDLADNYFFETVVRLHRAGESEPYTGLRPAGTDLGPVIPVADKAVEDGSAGALLKLFPATAQADIEMRLKDVVTRKSFKPTNVEAGRAFVKTYIGFMHYVEHLYEDTKQKNHDRATGL